MNIEIMKIIDDPLGIINANNQIFLDIKFHSQLSLNSSYFIFLLPQVSPWWTLGPALHLYFPLYLLSLLMRIPRPLAGRRTGIAKVEDASKRLDGLKNQ